MELGGEDDEEDYYVNRNYNNSQMHRNSALRDMGLAAFKQQEEEADYFNSEDEEDDDEVEMDVGEGEGEGQDVWCDVEGSWRCAEEEPFQKVGGTVQVTGTGGGGSGSGTGSGSMGCDYEHWDHWDGDGQVGRQVEDVLFDYQGDRSHWEQRNFEDDSSDEEDEEDEEEEEKTVVKEEEELKFSNFIENQRGSSVRNTGRERERGSGRRRYGRPLPSVKDTVEWNNGYAIKMFSKYLKRKSCLNGNETQRSRIIFWSRYSTV